MRRDSFRMQIAGTPGPVTDMTAVPTLLPHTPTERIIDRRQRIERRQSAERRQQSAFTAAADWTPGAMPALSKRALIGLCLITFSSGILVATAIYRLRTRTVAAQPAAVERIAAAPAASVVEIQPLPKPQPTPAPEPAPEPETVAEPEPVAAVSAVPPAAKAAPAVRPAPAVRVRPAPPLDRPKRPVQATDGRVATARPTEPDPFATAARPKPASKKWVDPFAE